MTKVLLSSKKGYIFIQTDKPIYTTDEQVKYRIYTLDNYMRPSTESIKITIYNSKNVQFYQRTWRCNKVFNRQFNIPDIAEPGNWRIDAELNDFPMSRVSAEFEVKEFVLPSFKVELRSEEMYYLISREEFRFKIAASHTFGKTVTGMAYVRFAIMDDGKQKIYLRGLEQQLEMKSGEAVSSVKSRDISESYSSKPLSELVGHRLYIAVTVFEISSGLMEELEISNIKFVSSPYIIDLSRTLSYFTPQLPFSVLVRITYPDGSPANNVPVWLEELGSLKTNKDGMVLLSMSPPSNTETFDIKVFAGDQKDGEISEAQKKIQMYQSENKNYLHISVPPNVLDPESSLSADISAITAPNAGAVEFYYFLIISKGKVVKMGHVQKSQLTKLTVPLSVEMVPSFRLVLYYFISVGGKTEMVANSAWIDVKDVCEAEIEINVEKNEYEPDSAAGITIQMGDAGQASLAMVDSAIYILNSKNKLTTKQLFERMNSYDLGCSFGGGMDNVHVFMDAGLAFISNTDASKFAKDSPGAFGDADTGPKCKHGLGGLWEARWEEFDLMHTEECMRGSVRLS
ncbi:complement C3-like, partial [Leucoraja erinacea]|uniref:complement C3-like n=1 Tax=Leucoraja erinaceus TaxID=7782 RepID=UPI0024585EFC